MTTHTREYNKAWYKKNKDKRDALNKKYKKKLKDKIQKYKSETPCTDCGIKYPYYVMQFDHVRGIKKDNIAAMVAAAKGAALEEELLKCELVCANCHAERTHKRRTSINSDATVL